MKQITPYTKNLQEERVDVVIQYSLNQYRPEVRLKINTTITNDCEGSRTNERDRDDDFSFNFFFSLYFSFFLEYNFLFGLNGLCSCKGTS